MKARNTECYAEVTEILQSKKLRDYIKLRLYVLKMNNILYEEDVINYAALCLVTTLRSGKTVPYPIAWAKVVLSRDTCKNLQDGLESVAISSFHRFPLLSL